MIYLAFINTMAIWLVISVLFPLMQTGDAAAAETGGDEAEFSISSLADPVVLPASFEAGSKPIQCILDTGHTLTTLDARYRGLLTEIKKFDDGVGMLSRVSYESGLIPRVDIAGRETGGQRVNLVPGINEESQLFGESFSGVIGCRSLESLCLRLDFEKRKGTLGVRPLDDSDGLKQRFGRELGIPQISVDMGLFRPVFVDTGNMHSISMTDKDVRRLEELGAVRVLDLGPSAAGTRARNWVMVRRIELGGGVIHDAVGPVGNLSTVGMRILCRYRVCFDFPRRLIAFRPREGLSERIQPDASGVAFRRTSQGTIVDDLYTQSVAYEAGLRVGDRIVSMDGQPVEKLTFGQIQDRLTRGGEHVTFVVDQPTGKPAPAGEAPSAIRRTLRFQLRWPFTWPPKWPEKTPPKKPIPLD